MRTSDRASLVSIDYEKSHAWNLLRVTEVNHHQILEMEQLKVSSPRDLAWKIYSDDPSLVNLNISENL